MLKTSGNIYVKPTIKAFKGRIDYIKSLKTVDGTARPAAFAIEQIRILAVECGIDLDEQPEAGS